MQRTLRLPIKVSHFENGGRMIDANARVLPEATARCHAKPMALRVVAHAGEQTGKRANEQTAQAIRPPHICVTDRDALPRFTRRPVDRLVNIARRSAGSTTFRCVRTAIGRFRTDSALSTRQISYPSFV
ncbi:hypothetical protein [Burkholderia lata]|uniref:LysR family transcriptional regulator n=1 Tax=Burkholderia lata (strain ATCC 17760 / DSM 23089 / LMG 22485 / NCIMB 9086 / R18194 / 383) TaxID=482957 RepID=A0A6P2ZYU8_BURL3|nr:hypothetical protein [Burkholderia lata]VWD37748.1 LysR family transcriptional regulator [Burkholderia lata]